MEGRIFSRQSRQYLMGLAIIGVVMVHVSTQQPIPAHPLSKLWPLFFSNGHLGVNIFFLLSTYGLCFSYNSNKLSKFYTKRFMRIWPIYPVALIARYIIKGLSFQESIVRFFLDVTGLFLFEVKRDFFWYMGVLTILYLLFPLIYKFSYATRKFKLFVIYILCLLVWFGLSFDFGGNDIYMETITRIPCIYIGIFSYLCEKEGDINTLYLGYGFLALFCLTQIHNEMTCLLMPAAMLLISKVQNPPLKKYISFFGKHSLEIYLGHTFAVYHILEFPFSYPVNIVIFFILASIYSTSLYFVQILFTKYIYKPSKSL